MAVAESALQTWPGHCAMAQSATDAPPLWRTQK